MAPVLTAHRVLVVDDEHVVADTLVAIFKKVGYLAVASYSAEDALVTAREWRPQLAIIDIVLPKMNGIDLALLLQVEVPDCHVTLFSGQACAGDMLAESNADFEVLAKPVAPEELLRLAAQLLVPDPRSGGLPS